MSSERTPSSAAATVAERRAELLCGTPVVAQRIARRGGLNAAAFPDEWVYAGGGGVPWDDYLPSLNSLAISGVALWEYMALAFDWRRGPAAR